MNTMMMTTGEDRLTSTADALARWLQSFQPDILIDGDDLRPLTSSPNLQDIWHRIIRHYHPIQHVKKVKETLRIDALKKRHPDRWEQHSNAQIQERQIEQRIGIRLRELYSARTDQSTTVCNELNRVKIMINDEYTLVSALDSQLDVYRQLSIRLNRLYQAKEQLNLVIPTNGSNNQELLVELFNSKVPLADKLQRSINLNDLCTTMHSLTQHRINQLGKTDKEQQERISSTVDTYEQALTKANLAFTKQFLHLANVRSECAKLRARLDETKRDVLSARSMSEQVQLAAILDAMIASKTVDVHLNLLKKKVQSEVEQQVSTGDEKMIARLHQQLSEKRAELARLDVQLMRLMQDNPMDKLDKLELKVREYTRLLADLPTRLHSLNMMHLALSNDLRTHILAWPIEQFGRLKSTEIGIDSPTTSPPIMIPMQTPTTPLTSLKQLLGIRTQDTTILEPPPAINEPLSKGEDERWDIDIVDDRTASISLPTIVSIDYDNLARIDTQMESALIQCQQDLTQFERVFKDLSREIRVLHHELTQQPAFHS